MSTLKERFVEKFKQSNVWKSDTGYLLEARDTDVLAFFQQELLALAEEIEKERAKYVLLETAYGKEKANGLWQAANLIRSKAAELIN